MALSAKIAKNYTYMYVVDFEECKIGLQYNFQIKSSLISFPVEYF